MTTERASPRRARLDLDGFQWKLVLTATLAGAYTLLWLGLGVPAQAPSLAATPPAAPPLARHPARALPAVATAAAAQTATAATAVATPQGATRARPAHRARRIRTRSS